MRVLVTGSSGQVGGAIARHLRGQGYDVVGLARREADLPMEILQVRADIAAPDFVDCLYKTGPCDVIVHAAAALSKGLYDPAISGTNGIGTQQILHVANTWAVQSFVFISGVAVIGRPVRIPITEDHPVAPTTAYHASKLYGEHLVAVARGNGLTAVVLRLTAPVGPGTPSGRILTAFVEQAKADRTLVLHGKGARRQNYVDIRDAARAVESCIELGINGLFNIGGVETIANHDLARRCVNTLDSKSTVEFSGKPDPDDEVNWEVSSAAAKEAFGYEPIYTIEDSIRSMV